MFMMEGIKGKRVIKPELESGEAETHREVCFAQRSLSRQPGGLWLCDSHSDPQLSAISYQRGREGLVIFPSEKISTSPDLFTPRLNVKWVFPRPQKGSYFKFGLNTSPPLWTSPYFFRRNYSEPFPFVQFWYESISPKTPIIITNNGV